MLGDTLKECFEKMLVFRKSINLSESTYRGTIIPFIDYCGNNYPTAEFITQTMVDEWLSVASYSVNNQKCFVGRLREFTRYCSFLGRKDFIPDEDYSVKPLQYMPFLFSDIEMTELFDALDSYVCHGVGKREKTDVILPVYARMMFCCGMRPQEVPNLFRDDVDLQHGDIYIRNAKRKRDRHIIMSDDMLNLCNYYDAMVGERDLFFQRYDGSKFCSKWFAYKLSVCWAKIEHNNRGNPRPYDLRHSFASRNLIRWIEDGKDIMEMVPFLSSYMGHSNISSTLYYIHLLPENLRKVAKIDWRYLKSIYGKEGPTIED